MTSMASAPLCFTSLHTLYCIDDFPPATLKYLEQRGHEVRTSSSSLGVVQGIAVDEEGNVEAYADPRKDGKEGHAVVVQRT